MSATLLAQTITTVDLSHLPDVPPQGESNLTSSNSATEDQLAFIQLELKAVVARMDQQDLHILAQDDVIRAQTQLITTLTVQLKSVGAVLTGSK